MRNIYDVSLPSRERGLKYANNLTILLNRLSLPSRERGLKLEEAQIPEPLQYVAPLAGAWIEIMLSLAYSKTLWVAPLAGAWIEIHETFLSVNLFTSRSPRGSVD